MDKGESFMLTFACTLCILYLVSFVNGQSTYKYYNEVCDNEFARCAPVRGFVCKNGKCICGAGYYNSVKEQCVVKFGQSCFSGSHDRYVGLAGAHLDCDDSFAYCNQLNGLCECRRGYDCSSAANKISGANKIFTIVITISASILSVIYSQGS